MKVLSLFDGMACGMLAMQAAGIKVDRYVAYEIDKYAVQTSSHNFPMIEHRGDVFHADFTEYSGFDFLVGGSPCTYWSIAQKNNRETEASGMGWELFSQYVRALNEAKPMWFIYENNKSMSNAIRESITETFGFEPVCINSALVSAQNRQRLYWVGKRNPNGTYSRVRVDQPEDRGILLRDVLDHAVALREKANCLCGNRGGTSLGHDLEKAKHNYAAEPERIPEYGNEDKARPLGANYPNNCGGFEHRMFCENPNKQLVDMIAVPVNTTDDGKAHTLKAQYSKNGTANIMNDNSKGCRFTASGVAEPVNTTADGKSQTVKAQAQQTNVDNIVRYAGTTFGASGVAEPICVAERGRYNKDGSIDQHFEARQDGKTNTLTTVQKDNSVCEPVRVGTWPNEAKNQEKHDSQQYRIYSTEGKSVNLCGNGGGMGAKTGLYAIPIEFDGDVPVKAVSCTDGKTYTVYQVKDGQITIKGKQYAIKLADGFYIIRKLSVTECMRLQTVPEWYEFPVSDAQAYKMLGNGWTVEVIVHLINATQANELAEEQLDLFKMWGDANVL